MIVHHAKQTLITHFDYNAKTARARGKVRAQYRWAYATSTLLLLQEIGQNQHEKGEWAYNTSWAYNTYSTVLSDQSDITVEV